MQDKRTKRLQLYEVDFENDDDILDFTLYRWENRHAWFGGLYKRWLETIAAYQGFFHYNWDEALRRFTTDTKIPSWRQRLVINLCLPRGRTYVSKLLRTRPQFDVLPASSDTQDIDAASFGKKILQAYWYNKNWNFDFIELLLWIGLTGNGFLYPHWDPNKGPTQKIDVKDFLDMRALMSAQSETEQDLIISEGSEQFKKFVKRNKGDEVFLGDVEWDIPSPFDVIFPLKYKFDNIPWLIRAQVRERGYYEDLGIDTSEFSSPSEKDNRYVKFLKRIDILTSFDSSRFSTEGGAEIEEGEVLELQLWLPRSQKLKKGFRATIAGGKVVIKGDNPYDHKKIPMIHFFAEKVPGKIMGFSPIEQALPQMREYIKTKSQLTEIKNLMSKPKWAVSSTTGLKQTDITSEPGEVLIYNGALPPTPITPPNPPRFLFDMLASSLRDVDEITAQKDATRGVNPSGSRSGTMLANLQDQDEAQLSITGLCLDTSMSLAGRLTLSIINQFVTQERLYVCPGEKKRHEVLAFKKGMLVGKNEGIIGADYFNVRVNEFSQFSFSRAGQVMILEKLLQFQIFKPEDRDKIFKWLQVGYFEDEIDEYATDRSVAYQENVLMSQGQMVPVLEEQNHRTHKLEHMVFMNSDVYRNLPPQIKQIFSIHLKQTELMEVRDLIKPQILSQVAAQSLMQEYGITPQGKPNESGNGKQSGNQQSGNQQSGNQQSGSKET